MSTKRKQGRPRKSKADKRTEIIAAKVTPSEKAEVKRSASDASQSLSDFARGRLLQPPQPTPHP